ncbi:23S rRNA (uracil-5-)-methyltransferase RumA [Anoxybacter fermentans]|uniref:23S rRNA (Uracil-5-)-methyltransferase RumA n=1 Tax=Anoxybacter fermentans TaxID=1323375 RepID=A0A3S9SUX6_9FIRM|nr:23S rRNA (uracil(1939)-C(5))-methyltransferase RlmD [Anoxybacter fermentans]AZR72082.1 23S rRNA (uracil-5-)-methyltransferase RumA [Anoxybacter fermentans]
MVKPVKKGEIVTIELDNLAYGGEAVGRVDNFAIFVAGGIPGEKVKVRITEVKKRYGRGELIEILNPSPFRAPASCDVYTGCGGCQLQHVEYKEQLKLKRQIVVDAIERIGGLKGVKVHSTLPSNQDFYRNKAQFPLGVGKGVDGREEIITGFYAPGTHKIVPNNNCCIQHPLINRIVRKTLKILNEEGVSIYDERVHKGLLRHLLVRVGVCTNQAMLVFVTNGQEFPKGKKIAQRVMDEVPELVSVLQNINTQRTNVILGQKTRLIAGKERIIDYIGDLKFEISAQSFFQVNTLQSKVLYDRVLKYANLSGKEIVLDAYCGIGTISLYLAQHAGVVHGIEVVQQAIEDAEQNAVLNGIKNTFFYTGLVEEILPRLVEDNVKFDVVVVDPPRKGCHTDVLKVFGETKPERIVYVSCNPTTLARDLAVLVKYGYEVIEVQPVDMFPHTYHVESVVLIKRKYMG